MTNETKLTQIERKMNIKNKVTNWIKVESTNSMYTIPDGRHLTHGQYEEFCARLQPNTGVILVNRISTQLQKEE